MQSQAADLELEGGHVPHVLGGQGIDLESDQASVEQGVEASVPGDLQLAQVEGLVDSVDFVAVRQQPALGHVGLIADLRPAPSAPEDRLPIHRNRIATVLDQKPAKTAAVLCLVHTDIPDRRLEPVPVQHVDLLVAIEVQPEWHEHVARFFLDGFGQCWLFKDVFWGIYYAVKV
jgi:hypothetical protein